jgi:hypothetical protein
LEGGDLAEWLMEWKKGALRQSSSTAFGVMLLAEQAEQEEAAIAQDSSRACHWARGWLSVHE